MIRIFFVGDVVGRPGRRLVQSFLPEFRKTREIDFVIANGENAAHGKGLTASVVEELFSAGVDVITGGNHIWQNKDIFKFINDQPRILRPANYPNHPGVPGRGYGLFHIPQTQYSIGIINLMGRVFMTPIDCPFSRGSQLVEELRSKTQLIFVDIHAEATSEKIALSWVLDGKVTAVVGTHTHVPTADEKVTEAGTAYQTDAGMTGPYDSVLGVCKDQIIHTMVTHMPVRHEIATGDLRLCGLLIHADPESGRARKVERICHRPS
ncbi:MAG: TIGR00282 family metallophosphoesterase [Candidatus Sumerlaeia bacterium]